jgi:hypothetical protein
VRYDDKPLGGTNIQVVVGPPDQPRRGLNENVAVWLDSGWWVTSRNQFALDPWVGTEIALSMANHLNPDRREESAPGPDGRGARIPTGGIAERGHLRAESPSERLENSRVAGPPRLLPDRPVWPGEIGQDLSSSRARTTGCSNRRIPKMSGCLIGRGVAFCRAR